MLSKKEVQKECVMNSEALYQELKICLNLRNQAKAIHACYLEVWL